MIYPGTPQDDARVGRVQRWTKFDEIFIYNFFPAGQINKTSVKEAAESKIAFIEMLVMIHY